MDKLKRCRDMFIKFDDNGDPEYGWIVEDDKYAHLIKKLVILNDKNIDENSEFILPDFGDVVESSIQSNEEIAEMNHSLEEALNRQGTENEKEIDKFIIDGTRMRFVDYLKGYVEISGDCLDNINCGKITVSGNNSIRFNDYPLSQNKNERKIEWKFPEGMSFMTAYIDRRNYTIIAHKEAQNIKPYSTFYSNSYCVRSFEKVL